MYFEQKIRKPNEVYIASQGLMLSDILKRHQHYLAEDVHGWENMQAKLNNEDLSNIEFEFLDFAGMDLSGANLEGCRFLNTVGHNQLSFEGTFLDKTNFTGAEFVCAVNLKNVMASDVNFNNVIFRDDVNIKEAELHSATFDKAQFLKDTNINKTTLNETTFAGAHFAKVLNIFESKLEDVNMQNIHTPTSSVHSGSLIWDSELKRVDFSLASINEIAINACRGEFVNFTGAEMEKAHIQNTNWSAPKFDHANLIDADMENVEIRGASFHQANLNSARILNSELSGANFHHAIMVNTGFNECQSVDGPVSFKEALMQHVHIANSQMPYTQFMNTNMQDVSLVNSELQGSLFYHVTTADTINCLRADLSDSLFNEIDMSGFMFTDANIKNTVINNAFLNGIDWSNQDLSNVKIKNSYLEKADLQNAIVTGAELSGVNAEMANCIGVDWSQAKIANTEPGELYEYEIQLMNSVKEIIPEQAEKAEVMQHILDQYNGLAELGLSNDDQAVMDKALIEFMTSIQRTEPEDTDNLNWYDESFSKIHEEMSKNYDFHIEEGEHENTKSEIDKIMKELQNGDHDDEPSRDEEHSQDDEHNQNDGPSQDDDDDEPDFEW